ncbi:uncharacterized protein LOC141595189 [Silene latifolia]|uniref:uncharacterized protein LOC141595189 n=1 Tax=Silene latifolia TaxID=37657 RepID=UPI003D77E990
MEYTIANGYNWLTEMPSIKVQWYKVVWNKYNVPRCEFIIWLIQHKRLLTLDRLKMRGMDAPEVCFLCGSEPESHIHLFQECCFMKRCMQLLVDWVHIPITKLQNVTSLLKLRGISALSRKIIIAHVVGIHYWVWRCRNLCRMEHFVMQHVQVFQLIKQECYRRFQVSFAGSMSIQDRNWCQMLSIC